MKQPTKIKIYRENKLDIRHAIKQELKYRAGLMADAALEIGKCIADDFVPSK